MANPQSAARQYYPQQQQGYYPPAPPPPQQQQQYYQQQAAPYYPPQQAYYQAQPPLPPKTKTYKLVHPELEKPPTGSSDDKYQVARKLGSEAYKQYFQARGQKVFTIVIKEQLSRDKKKFMREVRHVGHSDKRFFAVYQVTIDDSAPTNYEKDGKVMHSAFKPHIKSLNNKKATPEAQQLLMHYLSRATPSMPMAVPARMPPPQQAYMQPQQAYMQPR